MGRLMAAAAPPFPPRVKAAVAAERAARGADSVGARAKTRRKATRGLPELCASRAARSLCRPRFIGWKKGSRRGFRGEVRPRPGKKPPAPIKNG